ncbi:hypothetical protein [Ornithinibacillus sp. JPR2-1]|uniref:hypothetical protein n=1 Tax=Ornithinibacillus sp. JPR2-1 TaxID=2094019 RepID=UPI0031D13A5E
MNDLNNPNTKHTEGQTAEVIKEIEGKFGGIRVMKFPQENVEGDADINSLIARILLMKQKRLATGN